MKTLTQIEQYCRAECGALVADKIDSEQIKNYVNYEQTRVQNELFAVNFKTFKKSAIFTGATFAEPTDLMQYPNSIINLRTSAGTVRASKTVTYATPTGNLIHTYKQPGTAGNLISVSCDGATFGSPSAGTVLCSLVGGVFYFDFASGVLTGSEIVALFNANPVYSQYFTCSTDYPSAVIVPSTGTSGLLTGGVGGNYYPAVEVKDEDFVRINSNPYKSPSESNPKYRRIGNANGKIIQVYPETTAYCEMEYFYKLADLSASSDVLKIPPEIEELVVLGVQSRMYEKTGDKANKDNVDAQWQNKWNKYLEGYKINLESNKQEQNRLQTI